MLTDAWLRNWKYNGKDRKKNRKPDRDGLYGLVLEGGSISFRYDFDDPEDGSHQIVVYGRYHGGDTGSLARIDAIGHMAQLIPCSTEQETSAIAAISSAVGLARSVFCKSTNSGPTKRGRVPLISLEEARDMHREFRRQLSRGINPAREAKKAREAAERAATLPADFRSVAERWYEKNKVTVKKNRDGTEKEKIEKSASWKEANRRYLDAAYPHIGKMHVQEIKPETISVVIKPIEHSGRAVTAAKMRQCYAMVFDHAAGVDFLMDDKPNPARTVKVSVPEAEHFAHLDISEVPAFLKKVDEDSGTEPVRIAVRLLFLTLVRKMELCSARWSELDLGAGRWRIPPERMKGRKTHIVPLSRQAVALFRRLKELANGSEFVFPHRDDPRHCIGDSTLRRVYERTGYAGKATPHGCRSTASSALNEMGKYRPEVIERTLSHVEEDEVRDAYNHSDYMLERRRMLQDWADAIDRICTGQPLVIDAENVVHLQPVAA